MTKDARVAKIAAALTQKATDLGVEGLTDAQTTGMAQAALCATIEVGRCDCVHGGGRCSNGTARKWFVGNCDCQNPEIKAMHEAWCERQNDGLRREGYHVY